MSAPKCIVVERFRPWPGNPLYLVSDRGRVLSLLGSRPKFVGGTSGSGYRHAAQRTIHQMVLETFVGPRPPQMLCRHLNGVRSDNRLENLAWGTPRENARDRFAHGTAGRKLTERKVREILVAPGTNREIATVYGVAIQTISNIRSGRVWRHITAMNETTKKQRAELDAILDAVEPMDVLFVLRYARNLAESSDPPTRGPVTVYLNIAEWDALGEVIGTRERSPWLRRVIRRKLEVEGT